MMNTVLSSSPGEESVRASLQERKQEFARNAIWDAAIDLFFEKGFDETTVAQINANRCQVSFCPRSPTISGCWSAGSTDAGF